jgi:predicted dehydrogenase
MIKVGVIGLGMMGQMHLAAWGKAKGVRLRMVADSDPRRAAGDFSGSWSNLAGGADKIDFSQVRGTADPHELIHAPEVDLVDICVPTPFHGELALAAIAAGKHVLCEKPLARTAAEARRIARAAAAGRGMFMPAMCLRFWPEWAWLKQAVEDGGFGRVISASFQRIGSMPPGWFARGDLSGGAILDLHLHDSDFVHHLFGMPEAVSSGGWVGPTGCVDHVHTRYHYPGGPLVTAEGSWAAAPGTPFEMSYRVIFERATADYRLDRAQQPLLIYQNGRGRPVRCPKGDGYQHETAYLARCIRSGEPPSVVTATEAAESIRLVEAEAKSALSGRPVRL